MRSLRGADGLRTIACLMVIFHHLTQKMSINAFDPTIQAIAKFFITGSSGVSVFFILSGFLLSMPFWEAFLDGRTMPNLRIYAARRAGRIMPGFFLNLFVCFFLGLFLVQDFAPSLMWRYFSGLTFTASFHWLTFFPAEINGPLWSIGFEVVSYVLMPLGMIAMFKMLGNQRKIASALLFWVKIWFLVYLANEMIQGFVDLDDRGRGWGFGMVGGAKYWMPRYNPIGLFGHYAMGVLAAGVSLAWSRQTWVQARRWLFDLFSLAAFGLWLAFLMGRAGASDFSFNLQDQPYYFPTFPALTAILLACLTQSNLVGRLFDNPFARFTARISFGLYLWHYLVMYAIQLIYPDYVYAGIANLGLWIALGLITLVVSFAIATASWYWFEKPLLERVQAWKPQPRGQKIIWSPFKTKIAVALGLLIVLPTIIGTAVRPSIWAFPQPYFVPTGQKVVIPAGRGTLSVQVTGLRSTKGHLILSLYTKGGFDPNKPMITKEVFASGDDIIEFPDIPYQEYMVAGFHDENDNKYLDWAGRFPREGLIQSAPPNGPWDFDTLKFIFMTPRQDLTYSVYYLQ